MPEGPFLRIYSYVEIYMTTNLINGKKYVGRDARSNPNYLGSGVFIKQAIEKYGKENFKKETLEKLPDDSTKEQLRLREFYWLEHFNVAEDRNFYNLSLKNGGMGIGDTHTEENKIKISERTKEAMNKPENVLFMREITKISSKGKTPYNKGKKILNRNTRKINKKFCDDELTQIRQQYAEGNSASKLSRLFNCSHHTIQKIVNFIKPYTHA